MMQPPAPGKRSGRGRTTLSDVAAHAGVSAVTASRALRKPEMVSDDLRQRVERAVRELGYIPNQLASALASARTRTIGVVVPSLTNSVFADLLRALHDVFLPVGYQVLVLDSRYHPNEEEGAIHTLLGQHPEAMIVSGIDQTARARQLLERSSVPVIQTMELTDDPIDINIGLDQRDAGHMATRYLLGIGCRRVGLVAAPLDPRAHRRRLGYADAMSDAGVDPTGTVAITPRPSTVAIGAELFAEVLTKTPDLQGIFCCNDDLALGVLFECQRRGIRVPDEMSIVGFNDLEFCATACPTLTSVATPRYEMGLRSAEIILEIISGSGERPRERRIDVGFKLIERDSTRRAAAGLRLASVGVGERR